ncbi:MAG: matrixin family metalloprotease [Halobacteriovoraceae bacterium]|nr:matrixin family metalloprotease [Halobacteriovoraceae bacterium]
MEIRKSLNILYSSVLLLGLATSCAQKPEESLVTSGGGASSGGASKWGSLPLQLKVSNSFSTQEYDSIVDMAGEWYAATDNQLEFFDVDTSLTSNIMYADTNDYNDSVLGVYKLSVWPADFPETALAVTQIFGIRKNVGTASEYIQITHADILINEEDFVFSTDENDYSAYDFPTVMLHEMGHFLGLSHQSFTVESVMQPSVSKIDVKRSASEVDSQNIMYTYGLATSLSSAIHPEEGGVVIRPGFSAAGANPSSTNVRILVELRADGNCHHVVDGVTKHVHKVDLKSKSREVHELNI